MATDINRHKNLPPNTRAQIRYVPHPDWGMRSQRLEVRVDGRLIKSHDRSLTNRHIAHYVTQALKAQAQPSR